MGKINSEKGNKGNLVGIKSSYAGKDDVKLDEVYYVNNGLEAIGNKPELTQEKYIKNISEMKTQSTYDEFDFENIWEITENRFPTLKGSNNIYVSQINAEDIEIDLRKEKERQIEVAFLPEIVDDAVFKYSIDNEEIATVSDDGMVEGLKEGTTTINIQTVDENVSKTISLTVIPRETLTGIVVTTPPSKTTYVEGQNFKTDGMVVTATYNDGSTKDVINYIVTDGNKLKLGKTSVTISYTENGITQTTTQSITVEAKKLTEIAITTPPSKTTYVEGQNFDLTGMKVTAIYNDGSTKEVTNYTITGKNNLTAGETSVTISYTENGVTKTTTQPITVKAKEDEKKLESIAVTKAPNDVNYIEGQNFDPTGMVVTATYNDGITKEITNYMVTDGNNLTVGKTNVTISYTEGEITKTTTQEITVTGSLEIEIEEYEEKQNENVKYITKISPETKIEEVLEKIETNGTIEIFKGTDKITDKNTKIATGMKIKITLDNEHIEYTAVVKGDANGDGLANINDIFKINSHRLGINKITGAYLEASDVNGDEVADVKDIFKINSYRLRGGQI